MTREEAIALILCAAEGLKSSEVDVEVKMAAVSAIEELNVEFGLNIHEARS